MGGFMVGIPTDEALQRFGDPHLTGLREKDLCSMMTQSTGAKAKSVMNLYYYFEDETDLEPCREHADPGLVTLLCCSSSAAGLQIRLPLHSSAEPTGPEYCNMWRPECALTYSETWYDVEPAMDACLRQCAPGSTVLLAIVGEALERLSGFRFPACRHRV